MPNRHDRLFMGSQYPRPFAFDHHVAQVFDDMASRSIPLYKEVIDQLCVWAERTGSQNSQIYDIGCSTGNSIRAITDTFLSAGLPTSSFSLPNIVGIDPSEAMLAEARRKNPEPHVQLVCQKVQEATLHPANLIVCHYTLQFLPVRDRKPLLKKFYESLSPKGGVLFLSEKVLPADPDFFETMTYAYESFKRQNGYSQTEIERKKEALDQVLVPLPLEVYLSALREAGFGSVEILLKWNQFVTLVAH